MSGQRIYAYVGNNPINATDPSGLLAQRVTNAVSSYYGSASDWTSQNNVGTRALGLLQAAGGVAEFGLGGTIGIGAGWTGVGAVAGGALMGLGADQTSAGLRTALSGNATPSAVNQGLQAAGASPGQAALGDAVINFGATIGGGGLLQAGARSGVWELNPLVRGREIEGALGANLPSNFPTIDRFANGTATSIKSIDLGAASYQNIPTLTRTLNGYVDSVAAFNGRTWAGVTVDASQITARQLQLAIPGTGSAAQQAAINAAASRAQGMGVQLTVTPFR